VWCASVRVTRTRVQEARTTMPARTIALIAAVPRRIAYDAIGAGIEGASNSRNAALVDGAIVVVGAKRVVWAVKASLILNAEISRAGRVVIAASRADTHTVAAVIGGRAWVHVLTGAVPGRVLAHETAGADQGIGGALIPIVAIDRRIRTGPRDRVAQVLGAG